MILVLLLFEDVFVVSFLLLSKSVDGLGDENPASLKFPAGACLLVLLDESHPRVIWW